MRTEKELITDILKQTENLLTHYPKFADDPVQEHYYCISLPLSKSEMTLVQNLLYTRLNNLKDE